MKRFALLGLPLVLAGCEGPTTVEQEATPAVAAQVNAVQADVIELAQQYGLRVTGQESEGGKRVLLLADVNAASTDALEAALAAAGNLVVRRNGPDHSWDGTNPPADYLEHFDAVVHLNGLDPFKAIGAPAQQALTDFVRRGGTYVSGQWTGREASRGLLPGMEDLALQRWQLGADNCARCDVVYATVPGKEDHRVLRGVPASFTFRADEHAAGPVADFDEGPPTVLMRTASGWPAVLVRLFEDGRIVNFSHAANAPTPQPPQTLHDTRIRQLYVNAVAWSPPVADVGGPYGGDEGTPIAFDASGSSGENQLSFAWDFGDGATGTGPSPSHTYLDNGTYTVSVTVTDPENGSATATTSVEVHNVAPWIEVAAERVNALELAAAAGVQAAIQSGQSYGLEIDFGDPGVLDAPWSYTIDWADGTSDSGSVSEQTEPLRLSHGFCAAGDYSISLSLTDKDDGRSTLEIGLSVFRAPVAIDIKAHGFLKAKPRSDGRPKPNHNGNGPTKFGRGHGRDDGRDHGHDHGRNGGGDHGHDRGRDREHDHGHAGGVIPVAVLSTPDFDASTIDPASATLGDGEGADAPVALRGNGAPMASVADLDGDGDLDLMLHFERAALFATGDLDESTTHLVLRADLNDGCGQIDGVDEVAIRR